MGYLDDLPGKFYDILKDGVRGFVNSQARDAAALSYGNNIDGNSDNEVERRNGLGSVDGQRLHGDIEDAL